MPAHRRPLVSVVMRPSDVRPVMFSVDEFMPTLWGLPPVTFLPVADDLALDLLPIKLI